MSIFHRLFTPRAAKIQASTRYTQIVAAARNPVLYAEFGIPDTLDGRFEALVLHLFIALERLQRSGAKAQETQLLQEAFFRDMDRALREMGVSDTGVGKRVKKMASAFYGQVAAYREALTDETLFLKALMRNVYATAGTPLDEEKVKRLAAYINQALMENVAI